MKKLLIVLIALLPIFPLSFIAAQNDDPECDPAALQTYLDTRQADVEAISAMLQSDTLSTQDYYVEVATIRHRYEDMTDVPECARELHRLMLAQLSANQDVIAYLIFGNLGDEERFSGLIDEMSARTEVLRPAAQAEDARLRALLPTPAIGISAPTSPLEQSLAAVEGVKNLRSVSDMNGMIILEIDTDAGYNTETTAQALYETSLAVVPDLSYFSVILWDAVGPATDWIYENGTWRPTELSITPAP